MDIGESREKRRGNLASWSAGFFPYFPQKIGVISAAYFRPARFACATCVTCACTPVLVRLFFVVLTLFWA
jgi:hypothetical protein